MVNSVIGIHRASNQALVHAKQNDTYTNICEATFGLAFFATPHRGGEHARIGRVAAEIAKLVTGNTKNNFLDHLQKNSILSDQLRENFRNQIGKYKILSICESLRMEGIGLIVDQKSATLELDPAIENVISVEADHRNVCKFESPESPAYQLVAPNLVKLAHQAVKKFREEMFRDPQGVYASQRGKWLVPHGANLRFSGRKEALRKLDEDLEPRLGSQQRVALYGLGGVGKTQIALKYVYWIRNNYDKISIFWVHANSRERFHQSYLQLAKELDIPGADSHQVDTLALVNEWLGRERLCGPWLMILQNADDVTMFQDCPADRDQETFAAKLTDYIPNCQHGALLVTARDKNVGEALGAFNHQILPMDSSDSIDMLTQILTGDQYTRGDLEKLANCLERVPLAMTQAAAYISKNSMRISAFLQLFEKKANALDILTRDVQGVDRPVAATWQMSFTQIREQNRLAADILSLMAFLDRNYVPDTLIVGHDESRFDTYFEDACGLLKAFSLIQESETTIAGEEHQAYSMQHIVQLVTRHWLASEGTADEWAEKALFAVATVFPPGEHDDWEKCEAYLPHVRVVLDVEIKSKAGIRTKAELQYHSSSFFRVKGYHARAEEMARQSITNWKEALGPDNASSLASYTSLSRILLEQGQIQAAREVQVEGLKAAEPGVEETHPAMLRARRHLAALDGIQGNFEEAYTTLLAVTERSQINPGKEHADTLRATRDLAVTLGHLGRHDEAQTLFEQVLEIRKDVLGEENLETLISMFDLAEAYKLQDPEANAAKAEALERKVVRVRQKTLAEEHPATILAMESLADSLRWQHRDEEAEALASKVEQIQSKSRRERGGGGERGLLNRHPRSAPVHTMSYTIQTYKLPQPRQCPWPKAVRTGGLTHTRQAVSESHPPTKSSLSSSSLSSSSRPASSLLLSPPVVPGGGSQRRRSNPVGRIFGRLSKLKTKVGAASYEAVHQPQPQPEPATAEAAAVAAKQQTK
ncbi:hypothetical protein AYL99_09356 [Fonsecaea erecta]|uniref:NB-ARC domain-containing protein n=1 Tax=Fonsecaea erecta TaxID=1367422 RepID=A0A178Z8R2_9EURO|nr:hypothetical protein AYL99_09356 [Fonsecaea erecta]OAP56177.1 hypothetical protein AYL99_09356 [Fonsecaea erecta]